MVLLLIVGKTLVWIAAGFAVAMLLCWLCWTAFKLVRRPEWGVPLCLALAFLFWGGDCARSRFLGSIVLYAVLAVAVLWPLGLAWRHGGGLPGDPGSQSVGGSS